jgi:hypothetical protein
MVVEGWREQRGQAGGEEVEEERLERGMGASLSLSRSEVGEQREKGRQGAVRGCKVSR